jgi:hypothetical protein
VARSEAADVEGVKGDTAGEVASARSVPAGVWTVSWTGCSFKTTVPAPVSVAISALSEYCRPVGTVVANELWAGVTLTSRSFVLAPAASSPSNEAWSSYGSKRGVVVALKLAVATPVVASVRANRRCPAKVKVTSLPPTGVVPSMSVALAASMPRYATHGIDEAGAHVVAGEESASVVVVGVGGVPVAVSG